MDTFVIILKFYSLIKIFNYNSTIFIIWSLNLFLWSLYGTSWSLKLHHMVKNLIIYFIIIWSLILFIWSHYGTLWAQYERYGHLFNIKKENKNYNCYTSFWIGLSIFERKVFYCAKLTKTSCNRNRWLFVLLC